MMLKKFVVGTMLSVSLFASSISVNARLLIKNKKVRNHYNITVNVDGEKVYAYSTKKKLKIKIVNCNKLTRKMLVNRKNKTFLVEVTKGKVIDNNKNGRILNRDKYNYITYRGVKGAKKGKLVTTYCVFDPTNNGEDTIIARYDKVNK